ncbi:hypothetical protein QQS21_001318 [Conoideocrella luteorostrata]|uniref:SH3 domain-containing protein n=1 Tax=Conoideocrella luteorostrata TaxID=1105319 RepID=A0AAJ0CXI5_9HYPO|nr:hypothetical protein QQS21_001318 [Conoideocrella luteorostrata]
MALENDVGEVVELILTPFNDIVDKATRAADHATDEEPSMRKAAELLVREGQRALNRLQPLCKKIFSQHGPAFVSAIKTRDDISSFHLELTHLLWEFDDYLTIETFNESKYTDLQSLCRNVAPKMYNVLVRMNIELLARVSDNDAALHIVPESPPTSPMFPLSPSTDSWHCSPTKIKADPDPPLLGTAAWADNSVNCFRIQSHPVVGQHAVDSQTGRLYSSSVPNFEFAGGSLKRQSYSSHSSRSSGSQSIRGFPSQSIIPIRERDELMHSASGPPPFPERISSRGTHTDHASLRKSSISRRVSGEYNSDNLRRRVTFEHDDMPARLPTKQCIISESSSFHRYKGFCGGAKEVMNGNDGVKQKQKPVHRTLSRVVAKCTGCSMELDYDNIETDLTNKDNGSLTKRDVGYRLRFLQKSHLPVKRATDALYGCLFCIYNGYTVEESDATVFFSADDLFAHLSRHPRPLPAIPGISVLYGIDVPLNLRNNFDLQFKTPPRSHPVHRDSTEIDGRPTGIAMKEIRRVESQRNLVDRDRPEELQVAVGARITGIKWPPQYKGRRIFAWHDGAFASVPSEVIMLIPPAESRLDKRIKTYVSGKAKWKFSLKQNKEVPWLKIDKGDTIRNIGCKILQRRTKGRRETRLTFRLIGEHPDHWCWCGTNAKGDWGIFPQAYIDPNTVQDDSPNELPDGDSGAHV